MRTLGIDPGLSGAMVLLDGEEVQWVGSWRKMAREAATDKPHPPHATQGTRTHRGKVRKVWQWREWEVHVWEAEAWGSSGGPGSERGPGRWTGEAASFRAAIQRLEEHRPWPPDVVVLEGLRPHAKARPQVLVTLGEAAGYLLRAFCPLGVEPLRPYSADWRGMMLGLNERIGAAACEEYAQQMAPEGLRLGDCPKGHRGHISEAFWMARYGLVQQRGRGAA